MASSFISRATALISTAVAVVGLLGIYIAPKNTNFIIIGVIFIIIVLYFIDKLNQINENTVEIKELHKKINLTERLHLLEKDLAE